MPLMHVTINSAVLYALAFLLTTILHELGHAFTGALLGSEPVLHHNFVEHRSTGHLSSGQEIAIALAGPLTSLLQGLIIGFVFLKSKQRSLTELFLLWLAVLGFANFLGHLMTGPVLTDGDIGKVFDRAGTAVWVRMGLAVVAAGLLLVSAYKLTRASLDFSPRAEWLDNGASRTQFSLHALLLPWLIGSAFITLLYLPVIAILSII